MKPFHESDKLLFRIDIPIVIDTFLLHVVQISMSRPCYINVFQWNRKCFCLRHVDLNSRFVVMTIDEVTFDRPEVGTGFSVICWSCQLRVSRFALISPLRSSLLTVGSRLSVGISECVVSSNQFCCTICYWEYEFITFCVINTSSALILRG